jgi:CubicO group peptidase (beta-lactamase class C family)
MSRVTRLAAALLLGVGLVVASPAPAPAQAPAAWRDFTRAFDAYAAADSVMGGAALFLRDGRITARHDLGWADRDARQRADTSTIYHWASVTKTLGAVAVLQLRDRGLLSLDDRVTRWIPELRQVHDPYGSMDSLTIRMLLSHSSGLQNPTWPWSRGRAWEPFEPTHWEQLVAMMPYQELRFAPGSRYGYSNPAFIYLARIVEQVTGDPWETYVQKNIFAPLGMTRSYFGATPYFMAADRSNNYAVRRDSSGTLRVVANGRDFDPGVTIPNSGWNAPLSDVATWMSFLTGAGRGDAALARRYETVLKRATLDEMWRPVVRLDPPESGCPGCAAMGLGFFLASSAPDGGAGGAAARLVGHWGEQAGFRSFLFVNPAARTGVLFVVNTTEDETPAPVADAWRDLFARAFRLLA